jgi:hypothetical protein
MLKTSVFFKAAMLAILITLVFASFPTASAFARGDQPALQSRWSDLVNNFERQSINHLSAHRWVEHWLATHKKASVSERAEIEKHLTICNSAFMSAAAIISEHAGFDAKGKVVERASAVKSIKDLAYFLRQHAGSLKNLQEHME